MILNALQKTTQRIHNVVVTQFNFLRRLLLQFVMKTFQFHQQSLYETKHR